MEKRKKWHTTLLLTVIVLTVYNILPTLFYYSNSLQSPLSAEKAEKLAETISQRVNSLEEQSKDWLTSFCHSLSIRPAGFEQDGQTIYIHFNKSEDAARLRAYLPKAASLIPFAPASLALSTQEDGKTVAVQRRIGSSLDGSLFSYVKAGSDEYRNYILDRAIHLSAVLCGPSSNALMLAQLNEGSLESIAAQIEAISEISKTNKAAANRLSASFTQGPFKDKRAVVRSLMSAFDSARDKMKAEGANPAKDALFLKAKSYLSANESTFASGKDPLSVEQIASVLKENSAFDLSSHHPLFSKLWIDWEKGEIRLSNQKEVPLEALVNEAARVSRQTNELLKTTDTGYVSRFTKLSDASGFLALDLSKVLQKQADQLRLSLKEKWQPTHQDLKAIPLISVSELDQLDAADKNLCLVLSQEHQLALNLHGFAALAQSYEKFPDSEQAQLFQADLRKLVSLLDKQGMHGYRASEEDIVFVKEDLFGSLLAATREPFEVKAGGKYAILELSTVEQRILADNKIDTQIHEELLKWQDEYELAQVNPYAGPFDVPKPTKNIFLSNMALSLKKLIRGDERKVLHWGLDLSGGKTVQVELRDKNNQLVTDPLALKQGINELYSRVNKMGVSEVGIYQLGNHIVLDFPGSQALSASELIKASSMSFHVVNENFSSPYSPVASAVQRFLDTVWNESLIAGYSDSEHVHAIAYRHLQKDTESSRILRQAGLSLQPPEDLTTSNEVNQTFSKIVVAREQTTRGNPLLIVFKNIALEGSDLDQVAASYDPQKGNFLNFTVKSSAAKTLSDWTDTFARDSIAGTELESVTQGRGWRMAVVLNGAVISAPTLDSALKDSASITGNFSQREVSSLVSDLKAGSLTFTPRILSEQNVSPELGQKERSQGIGAIIAALALVVISMVGYYRFAGLVASVAVFFNLLILWAILQNIGATLSLAGIAGVILTVGMAVDANVLVFERVKEEFAQTGRIATAIRAGYEKAYSAILDSNVTTVIAALILLNFDAGPIKGFALTLIIGILSSMFTALFATRFYFEGWVQNPKNTALKMADWVQAKSIDFLGQSKKAALVAGVIIVAGCSLLFASRSTVFGMDFTGGHSLHMEVKPTESTDYVQTVYNALVKAGANPADLRVKSLSPENSLRLLFSPAMEQEGRPFYNTGVEPKTKIDWIVAALQSEGIRLTESSQSRLEKNWTSMSGQMSDMMRNNALLGLLIAFVCIFIYITVRFEYKYAAAAILCVIHDVLITLGAIGLLHALRVPVQIDLNTIAAIMTIVGYSLNDTIIVFDRIREELKFSPKSKFSYLLNEAMNSTLSRTTITSGTTFLVLLALVIFGGASIFSFALVMAIGVFFGTLSSWYIAAPLVLMFHERETKRVLVEEL